MLYILARYCASPALFNPLTNVTETGMRIIVPILQMEKLRLGEMKSLLRSYRY